MKKVRINRKKWLRGDNKHMDVCITNNFLWDQNVNAGCCLGHVCKQISRKTEQQLNGRSDPNEVLRGRSILTCINHYGVQDNDFAEEAMDINDSWFYTDEEREKELISLFKKNGIDLEFYN